MTELYASLFTGFSGATHRVRARQYVDGLLGVDGRKSVAHIAAAVGGPEDEQRLRRFVSGGAWRWGPVRRALAQAVTARAEEGAGAWVVGPVSIPKTGVRSVGVTRHYSRERERVLVGQLAFGAWFATGGSLVPVSRRPVPGRRVLLKHGTRTVTAIVKDIPSRLTLDDLSQHVGPGRLAANGIGRVVVRTAEPVALDGYAASRRTGSFLLIDPADGTTLSAGMAD
nr:transposase [Streptomyces bauhiniae]